MDELRHIDRAQCLRLLAKHSFGRLAVKGRAPAPVIRPVNYLFDVPSQSVVFRTAEGSKLHGLLVSGQAAFEIDGIDPENRRGWSVIVTGVVEEIADPLELRRLEQEALDPWAPGEKPHWMRIRAWTVSGRSITPAEANLGRSPANSLG